MLSGLLTFGVTVIVTPGLSPGTDTPWSSLSLWINLNISLFLGPFCAPKPQHHRQFRKNLLHSTKNLKKSQLIFPLSWNCADSRKWAIPWSLWYQIPSSRGQDRTHLWLMELPKVLFTPHLVPKAIQADNKRSLDKLERLTLGNV